jgi:putative glycerol kinase 5
LLNQAPINDESAATGYIGIKPSTRKVHLLRAAVESLAFRVYQMCQLMYQETGVVVTKMRVDGGVCRNDFLMQLISDLTMVTIDRPTFIETASHGAAMMAGLSFGRNMLTESQNKEIIWISFSIFQGYGSRGVSWRQCGRRSVSSSLLKIDGKILKKFLQELLLVY